jgi:CRP/FNR family cyclic AMP-dependent transcriptional regulator
MVKPTLVIPDLGPDDTEELLKTAVVRHYQRHAIIINEGDNTDSVYFIVSGLVKVFLSDSEGNEVVIGNLKAGDSFGEMALEPGARSASVMAMEAVCLATVGLADFKAFLMQHPDFLFALLCKLIRRSRVTTRNLKGLALLDVYGRLVQLLEDLAEEIDGKKVISSVLTQKGMANRIGCSREMVSKILKDLTAGGYLVTTGRQIEIRRRLPSSW